MDSLIGRQDKLSHQIKLIMENPGNSEEDRQESTQMLGQLRAE